MRSRYRMVDSEGLYFLTSTVVEWLPAFIGSRECEILLESLAFCRKDKGLRLYAYVIMENHLHLVAEAPDLSGVVQSFKRHTARELVQAAETARRDWLLNQWSYYKKKYKRESTYQVWQEGVHPQLIQDDAMLTQKIEYIHNNPVRRGWVDLPEHWRYSSARNYLLQDHSVLEIDQLPL
ncbi:MAG: transposase [Candidatus Hydrogenedentes bacterium]|nr:transposase [Candidatus Hydrogenedentota bacterium]